MTTPVETQPARERSWIYITACVILGILLIVGLISFRGQKESNEANQKADQLIAALAAAGARTPDQDQIVRVLGNDGGATCEDPNNALGRAVLFTQLANGAAGPGARPVIVDSRALKGQLLIIQIYCPNELNDFQRFVDDLKTDDVVGD
jgi:Tfp pilus assembly protein FimT